VGYLKAAHVRQGYIQQKNVGLKCGDRVQRGRAVFNSRDDLAIGWKRVADVFLDQDEIFGDDDTWPVRFRTTPYKRFLTRALLFELVALPERN
jgi:hypothetical protein